MDRYVYIELVFSDNKEKPGVMRFKAVDFGRGVESKIFDKPCRPIRPLESIFEKFLGISNTELEKFPSQNEVSQEFIDFIEGAHILCEDIGRCERALGISLKDFRTLAQVRCSNESCYFDESHNAVMENAKKRELTLADIQRIAKCEFYDACKIADDLVYHKFLLKHENVYTSDDKLLPKTKGDERDENKESKCNNKRDQHR